MSQGSSSDLGSEGSNSMRLLFGGSAEVLKAAELAALKAESQGDAESEASQGNNGNTARNGELSTVYEESENMESQPTVSNRNGTNGNGSTQEVPEDPQVSQKQSEKPQEVPEINVQAQQFLGEKEESQMVDDSLAALMEDDDEQGSGAQNRQFEDSLIGVQETVGQQVTAEGRATDDSQDFQFLEQGESAEDLAIKDSTETENVGQDEGGQQNVEEDLQNAAEIQESSNKNDESSDLVSVWAQKPEGEQVEQEKEVIEPAEEGEKDKVPLEATEEPDLPEKIESEKLNVSDDVTEDTERAAAGNDDVVGEIEDTTGEQHNESLKKAGQVQIDDDSIAEVGDAAVDDKNQDVDKKDEKDNKEKVDAVKPAEEDDVEGKIEKVTVQPLTEESESKRPARRSRLSAAANMEQVTPRSSRRTRKTETPAEEPKEEETKEKEEVEEKTPRATRGRRSTQQTPVEAPKSTGRARRGRKSEPEPVEEVAEEQEEKKEEVEEQQEEEVEEHKVVEKPANQTKKPSSAKKSKRSEADALKEDLEESGIKLDEEPASGRRSSRRRPAETPKAVAKTPAKATKTEEKTPARSTRTPKAPVEDKPRTSARTTAKSTPKTVEKPKETPKRKRQAKKEEEPEEPMEVDEEEKSSEEEIEEPTPKRGRQAKTTPKTAEKVKETSRRGQKAATEPRKSTKKAANANKTSDDPFDFDEQSDNHPQPLFNVSKAGFSNIKFTLSPRNQKTAESRYANTEKAAAERLQSQREDADEPVRKQLSITELSTSTPSAKAALKSITPKTSQPRTRKAKTPEQKTPKVVKTPREKKATPKVVEQKQEPEITAPEVDKKDQKEIDFAHEPFPTGMRVFALWGRQLYPAIVVDRDGLGRYKVFFVEDSLHRDIPPTGIVPLAWLKEGTKVTTTDDEGIEVVGEVTNVPDSDNVDVWNEAIFELKDGSEKYSTAPWGQLYLSLAQQKAIGVPANKSVVVGEDNVVPRSRRSHAATFNTLKEEPKSASRKRKQPEEATPEVTKPKRGRRSKASEVVADKGSEEEAMEVVNEDELFKGNYYLLTSSARRANLTDFNKREFKAMIEARGGTVLEEITDLPENATAFLVADTYYRTHKYLFALAADIPCVHYSWIQKCVDQSKILAYKDFLLPAGISSLDDEEHPCQPLKGKLLKDQNVLVYSAQEAAENLIQFAEIWRPMLLTLGAKVTSTAETDVENFKAFMAENQFDFVLTDKTCSPDLAKVVEEAGIPLVSSNLVIHGIVTGDWVDVSAHPSFAPTA
ncbi:unnamed protein product [Bursaphelenchus okinawaensis]|uniref:BRCT domain-containing protein n=1 Tax=Bursaphelenchus okinawaensis TaxID=465554 RepID=A0A811JW87_9BILA|nr:unnamed protein product [Bursaphelenchus okinawaensis]CAG9086627.1 unnamed protein product [Bursaphelenchus okinawaensis]